ncbi:toll-like receptor Tollo [Drosophila biarmipes]|uniref:toll-like receptor Tollo n=1 Tax=Drosophila biarmipes TaxID=125945 RepID=UPI0007E6B9E6|nr:toll-like receptor Tollo [Drosophila biarmipes]
MIHIILVLPHPSNRRKLLQTIPDDYCKWYCNATCIDTISQKTCDNEDINFILTNAYQLILNDGYLEVKWSSADPNITDLTPINKESNVKLKELIVSDSNPGIRGVDYLRQLGVEKVSRFEKQLSSFKALERNVHYRHGPKSLIIKVSNLARMDEIIDYMKPTMDNINEIAINANDETENQDLIIEDGFFKGMSRVTSLTLTGFKLVNFSTKTFALLVNLQKLVLSNCTINNFMFLSTLQNRLEHLVLDLNDEVDIKYFLHFPRLKLIKVRKYVPHENFTGLICTQDTCNFTRGINGLKCPEICDCKYYYNDLELSINCSNRFLFEIPPLPIPIIGGVKLLFSNNSLRQLPNISLDGYNMVEKLDVSWNMLSSLSIHNLPKKLDYLDISFNDINEMNREIINFIQNVAIFKQTGNYWTVHCNDELLLQLIKHLKSIIRMPERELRPIFIKLSPDSPEGFIKYLGQHFLRLGEIKQKYFLIHEDQLVPSMTQKIDDMKKIMSIYKYMEWLHMKLPFVNKEHDPFYHHHMTAACPYKCDCCYNRTTKSNKIDCRNRFLYYFPSMVPSNHSLIQNQNKSTPLELHLSSNNISKVTIDELPKNLRYLDLRNNSLEALDNDVIDYLKRYKKRMEIKLSGNPWNCDCKSRSILSFLRDHEPLEYKLTLNRCNISRADCPNECVCCWDNSTWSSFIVDCRGEGLLNIPVLSHKVTYVDLRNNNITELTPKNFNFLGKRSPASPLQLFLRDNPLSCSCQDLENINFMKSISSNIIDFTEINCSSGEKLVSVEQDIICPSAFAYYVALAISLAAVVIAINFMICFRQPLLMWFYEHDVCLSLAARRELDETKKFDAFLAFTHKDEALVEEFVDKLERGRPRFRLCFYLRDWLAGESIPDCIGKSVRDSRRIIILMTDNFMRSTWGRLEFRLALHATSKDRCKRLIVVLYPDVQNFDSLDSELRAYMVFNTYLERSHPNFWNKLIYSMPHTKI